MTSDALRFLKPLLAQNRILISYPLYFFPTPLPSKYILYCNVKIARNKKSQSNVEKKHNLKV